MECIRINGGRPLEGEVSVQSSKNAVLPILTAALLADGITVLKKCPAISDVFHMLEIIEELGCTSRWEEDTLYIDTTSVHTTDISCAKAGAMRSSCLFLGGLVGRFREAKVSYPGGCVIGKRPIDIHMNSMRQMGVSFEEKEKQIVAKAQKLEGTVIRLPYPSVGATENIFMTAVLADGMTKIYGCAKEPEVVELSCFLNKMGAKIQWLSDDVVQIEGVGKLQSVEYTIIPDRIVAGTYLLAAVATRGRIRLKNVPWRYLELLERMLLEMGAVIEKKDALTILDASEAVHAPEYVKTMPYPAFPTDLQPQLAVVMALADRAGVIEETVFESRFATVEQLKRMQADVRVEGNRICTRPGSGLYGANVHAADLRGGAALVMAGLAAEGVTHVSGCEFIERGYVDIVKDFASLGAEIEKTENRMGNK